MARTDADFAAYLKQRIEAAFPLGDLTPEEQAYWDEYDRACEEKRRVEAAYLAWMQRAMKAIADEINTHPEVLEPYVPGISTVMAEHGLRFVWEEA